MLEVTTTMLAQSAEYDVGILDFGEQPVAYPLRSSTRKIRIAQGRLVKATHLAWALSRADLVALIGADIIDGSYKAEKIHNWFKMVRLARVNGARWVALGSSCSAAPAPDVMAKLKRLSFIEVLARDPISKRRFEQHLGRAVELVADVAFLLRPELVSPPAVAAAEWLRERKREGHFLLGLNASGETLAKIGAQTAIDAHVAQLSAWLDADPRRSVLLVPHVFREATLTDLDALTAIRAGLRHRANRTHLLRPPFNAWDAKALAGELDAVLTGRMHFAIGSLGMGTPVLSTVYQGKFEGLMEHLGLGDSDLLLEPSDLLQRDRALAALTSLTERSEFLRQQIAAVLPKIEALAQRNFTAVEVRAPT